VIQFFLLSLTLLFLILNSMLTIKLIEEASALPSEGQPSTARALRDCSVLVMAGTQSGNALLVAEVVSEALAAAGAREVRLLPEGEMPDPRLPQVDLVVACVASHGDGELPDSFEPVFDTLSAAAPDLGHVRYGVVALGDRTYKYFCGGGHRFAALLDKLGARRVGEVCEIDASSQPFPDDAASDWLKDWIAAL